MLFGAANRGEVFQRFEAKYYLHELEAQALVTTMMPYVSSDPHVRRGHSYPILSLYLDSPDLILSESSEFGEKNRFKLRVRSYGEGPDVPVFLELKRRIDKVIKKERVGIKRSYLPRILRREGYCEAALLSNAPGELQKLYNFRTYQESIGAIPRCMVRYTREAYMSALEEPVRISLDRSLSTYPVASYSEDIWNYNPSRYIEVNAFDVMFEIKFNNALPHWVRRLIQRYELNRSSCAKYVECVRMLKNEGIDLRSPRWMSIL